MKQTKRIAAILLAMILLVTAIPLAAVFAADINREDLVWGDKNGITRAQWLHNLVVIFEMEIEPESLPDNYFSDLEETHKYYTDILTAVEFGVVDVGAGYAVQPDIPVTRDFAAYTLNFCLGYQQEEDVKYTFTDHEASVHADSAQVAVDRGWFALIGGAFRPETPVTTAEVERMLNDAADILEKEILDPNHEDVFEFQEDVIVLPNGTEVTEEDGTVSVTNCPKTIAAGNKFAAFFGGIPRGFQAVTVKKTGTKTVITTKDLSLQETFVDLDIQGVTDAQAMEFLPIGDSQIELVEEIGAVSFFAVQKIPTLKVTQKLNLGDGLSVSVSADVKNPRVEYDVTTRRAYVRFVGETEITYKAEAELVDESGDSITADLCKAVVPGVGGFKLSATFQLAGSASGTVKGVLTAGIECTYGEGIRAVKNFAQKECSSRAEATGAVGLKASLGINDMPIVTAEIYAEVGFAAKVEIIDYASGNPRNCSQFAGYLYAKYGAQASLEFGYWETSLEREYVIFDETNSPVRLVYHYENGIQVAECARGSQSDGPSGSFGSGGGGGASFGYYTNSDSRWSGNGWSGADNTYGVNADGESVLLYEYTVDENNEATITKYLGNAWTVYIPGTINGYNVVAIGSGVFQKCFLSGVSIPEGIKRIDSKAFFECANLRAVDLPDSMEILGCGAFQDCINLQRVYIPKNMRAQDYCGANYMYPGPFAGCNSLQKIDFQEGIVKIPQALFINCTGLRNLVVPKTVTSIEANAFAGCISLSTVTFPAGLTNIGGNAFGGCELLTEIKLPDAMEVLGCGAFQNCTSLEKVNIPKNMRAGDYCGANHMYPGPFANCESLYSITFASGITRIPQALFISCTGLKSITIPDSVTLIQTNAFSNCTNLESIQLSKNLVTIDSYAFSGSTALAEVKLPATLKTLGCGAFQSCTGLQRINIPKGMQTGEFCGNRAYPGPFNNCTSLTDVTFDAGFTTMPNGLFWGCTGLESITIPDTVTNISWKCFSGCTNLKTAVIGSSVTVIDTEAFYGAGITGIEIPTSVEKINARAFQTSKLVEITIPESVTAVGDHVLADCPDLKKVVWSATATTLPDYMFAGSVSIETLTLSDSITTLYKGTFRDCDSLKTVVLPDSIKSIGNELFYGCNSLETIVIPNSVTSLGSQTFYGCDKLKSVTLSKNLTSISSGTFQKCDVLEEVRVPNFVTSIGSNAFSESPMLKKVILPRRLTSVGNNAFSYADTTEIYGVPGTYAETWANENDYRFVSYVVNATEAQLSASELILFKGQSQRLELTVTPADANDAITFTCADTSIATVSQVGVVQAVKKGTTTVKVTVGDIELSCTVMVVQPVTSVSLDKTELSLEENQTWQLTATAYPSNAYDRTVTWSSSDETVASVSRDGLVTAKKVGTVTITATANDGSGKSKSCTVVVTEFVLRIGWVQSGGKWYFYENGTMVKNQWRKDSSGWCYLGTDGAMVTNQWQRDSVGWVYIGSNGYWVTNQWIQDGGKWYYLNANGYMVTNQWQKDSKGWVYIGKDGYMLTNAWCTDSQGWCYVGADGYAVTNCWKQDSVGWIWLDANGSMVKNQWIQDGGKWYWLNAGGYMVTNQWQKDSKGWVYIGSGGYMLTNAWCTDSQGWCYVGSDGYAVTNCWKQDSVGWIWLDSNGSMTKNQWIQYGGNWYYLDPNGYMMTNTTLYYGGKIYYFNASGICVNP